MLERRRTWPAWARGVASVAIAAHFAAVIAALLATPPSSPVQQAAANFFSRYYELIDQGHAHHYYIDPPPTPILVARLKFADGRPEQILRFPDRSARPRLRYQRQLALAYHLFVDVRRAREQEGDPAASPWARSYARHLCRSHPGCSGVTLLWQLHLVPTLEQLREAAERPGATPLDLDADEFFTTPERIGEFPCE